MRIRMVRLRGGSDHHQVELEVNLLRFLFVDSGQGNRNFYSVKHILVTAGKLTLSREFLKQLDRN